MIYIYTLFFFLLSVTRYLPAVPGNNDAIERSSSKKEQEGASLCARKK